jgi:hypothetical protein
VAGKTGKARRLGWWHGWVGPIGQGVAGKTGKARRLGWWHGWVGPIGQGVAPGCPRDGICLSFVVGFL